MITSPDFGVRLEGSIALFEPKTAAAQEWCSVYLGEETMWFAQSFVVEHRYVGGIVDAIVNHELELEAA